MLLLALSCLQGRPMSAAFDELVALGAGVQLTPGNHPTRGFAAHTSAAVTRTHHGFDFGARKRDVWAPDARCLVAADSVHPPAADTAAARAIEARGGVGAWLAERAATEPLLETMYFGYALGSGAEIEDAMALSVPLAVDVSHVFMQLDSGAMLDATWRRLSEYEHVHEVHVSANDGKRDAHAPIRHDTFGLDWARERMRAGVPIVLECYMHRLHVDERRAQVDLLRGGDTR